MARNLLFRAALAGAILTGTLALEGCGRKGYPEAPSTAALPNNSPQKLPHGIAPPALKAGASKEPTPFDFLL